MRWDPPCPRGGGRPCVCLVCSWSPASAAVSSVASWFAESSKTSLHAGMCLMLAGEAHANFSSSSLVLARLSHVGHSAAASTGGACWLPACGSFVVPGCSFDLEDSRSSHSMRCLCSALLWHDGCQACLNCACVMWANLFASRACSHAGPEAPHPGAVPALQPAGGRAATHRGGVAGHATRVCAAVWRGEWHSFVPVSTIAASAAFWDSSVAYGQQLLLSPALTPPPPVFACAPSPFLSGPGVRQRLPDAGRQPGRAPAHHVSDQPEGQQLQRPQCCCGAGGCSGDRGLDAAGK